MSPTIKSVVLTVDACLVVSMQLKLFVQAGLFSRQKDFDLFHCKDRDLIVCETCCRTLGMDVYYGHWAKTNMCGCKRWGMKEFNNQRRTTQAPDNKEARRYVSEVDPAATLDFEV